MSNGLGPERLRSALWSTGWQGLVPVAAGPVALVLSLVPRWYSASFQGASDHANAWHGFFPWFGVLLALAGSAFALLVRLNAVPRLSVNAYLVVTVVFGLATVFLILATADPALTYVRTRKP